MATDWDTTWMAMAHTMAHRSKCYRAAIGAVVVSADNRLVSTGYNGAPASLVRPVDPSIPQSVVDCRSFCSRANKEVVEKSYEDCYSVHAETNAIIRADWSDMQGGALYVTGTICWDCGKIIANSGIKRVVVNTTDLMASGHREWNKTRWLFKDCGMEVSS